MPGYEFPEFNDWRKHMYGNIPVFRVLTEKQKNDIGGVVDQIQNVTMLLPKHAPQYYRDALHMAIKNGTDLQCSTDCVSDEQVREWLVAANAAIKHARSYIYTELALHALSA
jgi:cation transport regulator ChaB